eukprot:gene35159-58062_t
MGVGWVEGHVEEMTLRVTKLRTFDGDLVTIANGELRQSVNASRDWARVLIKVPLGRDVDLDEVAARLDEVGAAMAIEPQWAPVVLEAPKVSGLDDLGADSVHMRVVGRTLPAQQWKVARELRRRIALALRAMDVRLQPSPRSGADVGVVDEAGSLVGDVERSAGRHVVGPAATDQFTPRTRAGDRVE